MNSVFGANSALGKNKSVTEGDSEYSGNYAHHTVPTAHYSCPVVKSCSDDRQLSHFSISTSLMTVKSWKSPWEGVARGHETFMEPSYAFMLGKVK